MSLKVHDGHGRWRSKTVAFRISPEEDEHLETAVRLSGLTKQDYIIRRLQCRDVVVQGNPRVHKALRNELAAVLSELQRIASGETVSDDLLDTIHLIASTMNGMKEGCP
jgi:electron transfer flavoprotein alpha/beta subunit